MEWISKNPWTKGVGMVSYNCDLTRPDDQEYEHVARIDHNKQTGSLGSEEYAMFHGWEIGVHVAGSGESGQKCVLRPSPVPFIDPLNVVPYRGWLI